jgi:hypothetical protein
MRIQSVLTRSAAAALTLLLLRCTTSGASATGGTTPADAGTTADAGDSGAVDSGRGDASGDATVRATEAGAGDAADGACPVPDSDAGTNTYAPDDPNIQYSGRFDLTTPTQPMFAASSVYITANFQGSSVSVGVEDQFLYGSVNFFEVVVDGFPPVKITPRVGVTTYPITPLTPPGLCDGVHKVTFIKRTEADIGSATFLGFTFKGTILPPDPKPTRRIEIIGDSITCGAGVEATSAAAPECMQNGLTTLMVGGATPQTGYGQGVENGYLAYGSVLARSLDAEWHLTCTSGIGLVRNYYNRDNRTMPVLYDLVYPENTATTPRWDTTQFKPDVIVIGLGTNDFSLDSADPANPRAALPLDTFEQGYIQFIDQLATYYPGVTVVLVSSPILGDPQLTTLRTAVTDVAAYYARDGGAAAAEGGAPDVRVFAAVVDKVVGTGCGGHPSIAQQASAAAQIAPVIQAAMGW